MLGDATEKTGFDILRAEITEALERVPENATPALKGLASGPQERLDSILKRLA